MPHYCRYSEMIMPLNQLARSESMPGGIGKHALSSLAGYAYEAVAHAVLCPAVIALIAEKLAFRMQGKQTGNDFERSAVKIDDALRPLTLRFFGWKHDAFAVKFHMARLNGAGQWGNMFIVSPNVRPGARSGCLYTCVPTVADAVDCYRIYINLPKNAEYKEAAIKALRGKNLACFCKIGEPCHADVLLAVVNEDAFNG